MSFPEPNFSSCDPGPIRTIVQCKVHFTENMVELIFSDGEIWYYTMDEANKLIKVHGIPVIDYYAKLN